MTPAYLASLCAAIYAPADGWFDSIFDNGSVCVGIQRRDGKTILAFRGSKTWRDWLRDFEAVPISVSGMGTIHEGFWRGVEDAFQRIGLTKADQVIITGHSLGGSHAALFAKLCLNAGISVEQLYLFATPKVGYADFHAGLQSIPDIRAWCNGLDPVPHVALTLPGFPWLQFSLIRVDIEPPGIGEFVPSDYHEIALYFKGVRTN